MTVVVVAPHARSTRHRRWPVPLIAALALSAAACDAPDDVPTADTAVDAIAPIEFRDEVGPHVEAPDHAMAMTVDAVDVVDDEILVRLRIVNRDDRYLDMGVQDTRYGPLLVMRDDREQQYESYADEPAGIPGRRIADLSFRLRGPLDPDATSFTLELATQRGPLTSPPAPLPEHSGIRWRIDDAATTDGSSADSDGTEPIFARAPRLPRFVDFWLETDPLTADR